MIPDEESAQEPVMDHDAGFVEDAAEIDERRARKRREEGGLTSQKRIHVCSGLGPLNTLSLSL